MTGRVPEVSDDVGIDDAEVLEEVFVGGEEAEPAG
jgi:hypothetical protein